MVSLALPSVNYLTIIALMLRKGTRGKILMSVVLVVISANFVKSTLEVLTNRKRLEEAEKREQKLVQERDVLKRQIEYKRTLEYIEESARNELNLIKPGEKVYVLEGSTEEGTVEQDDANRPDAAGSVAGVSDEKERPNWYHWYKLFF